MISVSVLFVSNIIKVERAKSDLRLNRIPAVCRHDGRPFSSRKWCRFALAVRALGPLFAGVACLFFCLGQFAGAVQKDEKVLRAGTVVAERFELLGPTGKRTALLRTDEKGATYLSFFDEKGSRRLTFGVSDNAEPMLTFFDSKGEQRLNARIDHQNDAPYLALSGGPPLGTRIALMADGNGGSLTLSQPKGGRLYLRVDERGQPTAHLHGVGNAQGVTMSAGADDALVALAGNGRNRVRLGLLPDGLPEIRLTDETNQVTSIMTLTREGKSTFRKP
jgi:hypothetical protein